MYELSQFGLLANELLAKQLAKYFFQTKHTPGIWCHRSRPIKFALVLYYFGVKCKNKEDEIYLIDEIKENMRQLLNTGIEFYFAVFC